jgi:hypothetical protein
MTKRRTDGRELTFRGASCSAPRSAWRPSHRRSARSVGKGEPPSIHRLPFELAIKKPQVSACDLAL